MQSIRALLKNMSIGTWLVAGFLVMVVFIVIVGVFGIYQMNRLADLTTRLYRHPLTVSNAVRDVNIHILSIDRSMKDVALTDDADSLEALLQKVEHHEQAVYAAFEIIKERFLGDQREIDDLFQAFQQWKPIRDEVIVFVKKDRHADALAITQGKEQEHVEQLQKELRDLTDFASQKAAEFLKNATVQAHRAYGLTLGCCAIAMAAGIFIALGISRVITRPLRHAVRVAEQVSEGNLAVHVNITSHNELGQMLSAMQRMIHYIQDVASVAEKISQQQLAVTIMPKSRHDVLNHSLQRMVATLQTMMQDIQNSLAETERQSWLKDGLNQLNASVLGELSLQEICRITVSFVARYVNAGHAVLYIYNDAQHVLTLGGTFAMLEADQLAPTYRLGEGIIGQVARDRKPVFLSNLRRSGQVISTGTVSEPPFNTYTFPLIYNEDLYGVLEVATTEALDDARQQFLNDANPVVATILSSALQRERVQNLLEQSQQTAKDAERAAHEAQQAREEAQQQSAELQRANVQLEEQQQQLQQQSEELRQINVHLEEQQQEIQEQRDTLQQRELLVQQAQAELERKTREFNARTAGELFEASALQKQPSPFSPGLELQEAPNTGISQGQAVEIPADDRQTIRPDDQAVLIIEDNADLAGSILEITRGMGYKALIALTGADGLALAARFRPAGILLDRMLPDLNGIEVLRELKRTRELRPIPVHIMSSKDRDEALLKAGAIGYAQKPIGESDIQQVVQRLLETSQKSTRRVLIVEDAEDQRQAIQNVLAEHGITDTVGVDSATAAIQEIENSRYDTAIIDLGLQSGSGYDICQYVKEQALDLPLIIYTAKDLNEAEERELRQYTDSIILKTAHSYERLLDEVANFLDHMAPVAEARDAVPPSPTSAAAVDLSGKKILIADDDIKNVFVLASVLEDHGATVVEARNGQEALCILHEQPDIKLVLMDVMMPDMDGYEAMQAIRREEGLKHLPIIAITAKTLLEDRQRCLEAGANDYLAKPVDYDGLLRLVNAWIEKNQGPVVKFV